MISPFQTIKYTSKEPADRTGAHALCVRLTSPPATVTRSGATAPKSDSFRSERACAMDEVPPVIAGRYRIEHEIGRGGMGTVYRALHLGLERSVAVKILKSEFAADPQVAERFMREARTMARLRHPYAATIFDAGTLPDNRPFIVMEYVDGETLAAVLAREGQLACRRAVEIAGAICEVLAAAHALGIVHRDLKPSNIMLTPRGVCVLDFGVAKVLATSADATRTHATTESGLIIGTPRYMSPEQCIGQDVGPQSDLYSLGVLLYEMLAGHPPFTDLLPSAVLVKQATSPPPPLVLARHDLPRPLVLAVHALLSKRAQDRPQSASLTSDLLVRSVARSDAHASAPELTPFAATVAAVQNGASSFPYRLLVSAVFAVVIGGLLLVWGRSSSGRVGAEQIGNQLNAQPDASAATAAADKTFPTTEVRFNSPGDDSNVASPSLLTHINTSGSRPRNTPLAVEEARGIAASVADGAVEDVRVVRVPGGSVIVATHTDEASGANQIYAIERRDAQYRLTARTPLDTFSFRSANWTSEVMDVDGDGYNEVLYKGTDVDGEATGGRRFVLYTPRTRKFYALRVEPNLKRAHTVRIIWSPSALTQTATPFRNALERRVRTLLASF